MRVFPDACFVRAEARRDEGVLPADERADPIHLLSHQRDRVLKVSVIP